MNETKTKKKPFIYGKRKCKNGFKNKSSSNNRTLGNQSSPSADSSEIGEEMSVDILEVNSIENPDDTTNNELKNPGNENMVMDSEEVQEVTSIDNPNGDMEYMMDFEEIQEVTSIDYPNGDMEHMMDFEEIHDSSSND